MRLACCLESLPPPSFRQQHTLKFAGRELVNSVATLQTAGVLCPAEMFQLRHQLRSPRMGLATLIRAQARAPALHNLLLHRARQGARRILDHLRGEALHLFQLRAELQQQQINAGFFKFSDALGHLLRRSHQPGAQPAV
jgi:hypothetical protein